MMRSLGNMLLAVSPTWAYIGGRADSVWPYALALVATVIGGLCIHRRHRHEWDATATNHYAEWRFSPQLGKNVETGRKTNVLRVCVTCGKRDVETLEGQWSLEQVRGLMAPTRTGSHV